MTPHTERFTLTGAAGAMECALDLPNTDNFPAPRGLALVAHPHPLFGGTMDNKVTQTLARSMLALGYVAVRMNFRGVGMSAAMAKAGVRISANAATETFFIAHNPDLLPEPTVTKMGRNA